MFLTDKRSDADNSDKRMKNHKVFRLSKNVNVLILMRENRMLLFL